MLICVLLSRADLCCLSPSAHLYRRKYQALFDPRCPRAASSGAAAQAEHVTGTHLYAFLQDTPGGGGVKKAAAPIEAAPALEDDGKCPVDKIREIFEVC